MFEPCNSGDLRSRFEISDHLTDHRILADVVAVTAPKFVLSFGVDKLISRINACRESVSPGVTPGIRNGTCQEIQLKSLILAQPERWRRG